jgi:hypothetical protein
MQSSDFFVLAIIAFIIGIIGVVVAVRATGVLDTIMWWLWTIASFAFMVAFVIVFASFYPTLHVTTHYLGIPLLIAVVCVFAGCFIYSLLEKRHKAAEALRLAEARKIARKLAYSETSRIDWNLYEDELRIE